MFVPVCLGSDLWLACDSFLFLISLGFRATIELGDVTPHNLQQLKRLNQVVFPVSYNDKFYKDILEAGELAKLGNSIQSTFSNQPRLLTFPSPFSLQLITMTLWLERCAAASTSSTGPGGCT